MRRPFGLKPTPPSKQPCGWLLMLRLSWDALWQRSNVMSKPTSVPELRGMRQWIDKDGKVQAVSPLLSRSEDLIHRGDH